MSDLPPVLMALDELYEQTYHNAVQPVHCVIDFCIAQSIAEVGAWWAGEWCSDARRAQVPR